MDSRGDRWMVEWGWMGGGGGLEGREVFWANECVTGVSGWVFITEREREKEREREREREREQQ